MYLIMIECTHRLQSRILSYVHFMTILYLRVDRLNLAIEASYCDSGKITLSAKIRESTKSIL